MFTQLSGVIYHHPSRPQRPRPRTLARAMSACVGSCLGSCASAALCRALSCRGDGRAVDAERGEAETVSERASAKPRSWRARYAAAFVLVGIATWILRDGGFADDIGRAFDWTCANADEARTCAHEASTRAMLGNALFFGLMLVTTPGARESDGGAGGKSARARWNDGYWALKFALWVGLCVAALAMPLGNYGGLVNANRFFAAVFLLIQLIVLLGWVYDVNDRLMTRLEESSRGSALLLLSSSAALYAAAFTLIGLLYKYWAPSKDCSRNIALITCMLVVCVIFTAVSLSGKVNGGLFTSGAMTFYAVYVLASALASEPTQYECAPSTKNEDLASVLSVIGFVFALCALGVTAHGASKTSAISGDASDEGDDPTSRLSVSYFHFVFFTASSYCAMLFVSWSGGASPAGWESVWAKVCCAYASAALYLWALVAPLVLKNRDFRSY